jgi:hypothetical protein
MMAESSQKNLMAKKMAASITDKLKKQQQQQQSASQHALSTASIATSDAAAATGTTTAAQPYSGNLIDIAPLPQPVSLPLSQPTSQQPQPQQPALRVAAAAPALRIADDIAAAAVADLSAQFSLDELRRYELHPPASASAASAASAASPKSATGSRATGAASSSRAAEPLASASFDPRGGSGSGESNHGYGDEYEGANANGAGEYDDHEYANDEHEGGFDDENFVDGEDHDGGHEQFGGEGGHSGVGDEAHQRRLLRRLQKEDRMRALYEAECPFRPNASPSAKKPTYRMRSARGSFLDEVARDLRRRQHQAMEVRQRIEIEEQRTLFKPQLVPALPSVAAQFSAAFHAHFTPNGSGSARKANRGDGGDEGAAGGDYAAGEGGEGSEEASESHSQQQPAFQRPPGANVFHRLYSSFIDRQQREQAEAELALQQQQQQQQQQHQLQSSAFRPSGSSASALSSSSSSSSSSSAASPRGLTGSGSGNGGAYSQHHSSGGSGGSGHGNALYQDAIERRQRMEAVLRRRDEHEQQLRSGRKISHASLTYARRNLARQLNDAFDAVVALQSASSAVSSASSVSSAASAATAESLDAAGVEAVLVRLGFFSPFAGKSQAGQVPSSYAPSPSSSSSHRNDARLRAESADRALHARILSLLSASATGRVDRQTLAQFLDLLVCRLMAPPTASSSSASTSSSSSSSAAHAGLTTAEFPDAGAAENNHGGGVLLMPFTPRGNVAAVALFTTPAAAAIQVEDAPTTATATTGTGSDADTDADAAAETDNVAHVVRVVRQSPEVASSSHPDGNDDGAFSAAEEAAIRQQLDRLAVNSLRYGIWRAFSC